ncbi:GNAT family N-acetyltransferase [Nocardioides flavescens]|uniref:Lysine N-acyltransferase MbtK n=1 Tax=Nocardioides flavescens TaxID=2691959 RepID=A0A6L7ESX3_9ACTN|nr:GNAT family N-acetyltransferase [Nocardioides flavescens]MXG89780.1 GNAT family N-acetyltransferase [Nocardioides flavescens]
MTFTHPTAVGTHTLEPLDVDRDAELLHGWVTHPRSRFWGMLDADIDRVRAEYAAIAASGHHRAWLGRVDGVAAYLVETYDPAHSELAAHYDVLDGDLGMHVLVAPTESPVRGFTDAVFETVMAFCDGPLRARRVVVEPDERNDAVRAKNVAAGFVEGRVVDLHDKRAVLSFRARPPLAHLRVDHLAVAQRHLVTKALTEFAHERLVAPERVGAGWRLVTGGSTYDFDAEVLPLEHWAVDPASVRRTVDGEPTDLDVLDLVSELQPLLGIPDELVGTYLEELSSTLASAMWKRRHSTLSARDLVDADFQTVEAAMSEGHPSFVANNGRIGFGVDDHDRYAPESGRPVRLEWVAARRDATHLALGAGVSAGDVQPGEVVERMRERGLDPEQYVAVPVHPWQLEHRLAVTFAPDVARGDLVPLGPTTSRYQAQQSIRTFFDLDHPERPYVKVALAIQNMGFLRGLSPAYMRVTPAINDWVHEVVSGDPLLGDCGFSVLREIASVGYTGDAYHRAAPPSPHRKMVAALWRESPVPSLAPGERLATMASLLHRDADGRPLVVELVRASGLPVETWVAAYLRAYLRPLLHCLRVHDLAFMPHGENLILVLRDHVPVRAVMKDIGEEVGVLADRPVPAGIERIRQAVDDESAALCIQTDVFDGVLRHLCAILDGAGELPAAEFWRLVADCVHEHRDDTGAAGRDLDLFAPSFPHSCLNRLQLRDTRQMVDLADLDASLMYAGRMPNPLAAHARVSAG